MIVMYHLPNPLTEDAVKELMKDRRHQDPFHPEYRGYTDFVTRAFQALYPEPEKKYIRIGSPHRGGRYGYPRHATRLDARTRPRDGIGRRRERRRLFIKDVRVCGSNAPFLWTQRRASNATPDQPCAGVQGSFGGSAWQRLLWCST